MFKQEIYYSGSREKLFRDIARVNGKRTENQQFSCVLYVATGRWKLKQFFRFLCKYQKCGEQYQITYRVFPTLSALRTVFALALPGVAAIASLQAQDLPAAILSLLLLLGVGGSYLTCQKECIREFEKRFGN